jgi:uncharacterized alkaline shock family protein YloU
MSRPSTEPTERSRGAPAADHGRTTVSDGVVQKIVGMAAREVAGVHQLGTGAARAVTALRERVPGSGGISRTQGVSVEVGEKQTAVDLDVVVDYGVSIPDLAQGIRRNVINSVERMTGLEVTEVNISVDDIRLPEDDQGGGGDVEPRVQ